MLDKFHRLEIMILQIWLLRRVLIKLRLNMSIYEGHKEAEIASEIAAESSAYLSVNAIDSDYASGAGRSGPQTRDRS
jgi:hypothetical protein